MSDNIRLEKMEKLKGYPFDEYRCFYIKDFRNGDSIRIKLTKHGETIRGVVTSVDLDTNVISYKTAASEKNQTTINKIVSLADYKRDWLEEK